MKQPANHPPPREVDVLVVLNHVFVIRNFVTSGVLGKLIAGGSTRVAVVVPEQLRRVVSEAVPGLRGVYALEPLQISAWRRRWLEWVRLGSFLARRRLPEYERKIEWNANATPGRKAALVLWTLLSRFTNTERVGAALVRRLRPNAAARRFVGDIAPRVVLWPTTITTTLDFDLVKAAADRGISIVFGEGSWDNLVTKGAIWPRPDRLLVWGEFSRRYAIEEHGFADHQIVVTGPPHFDVYARPDRLTARDVWFRQQGLDPGRRLIMVGGSTIGAVMEPAVLRMMSEWIEDGKLPPSYLWYRPHPKAVNRKRVRVADLASIPHVVIDPGVTSDVPGGDWVVHPDEPAQRANALAASDLVVSMFSTVVIEGALLGKPALLIEFARAGDIARRANRRYRDFGHVRYLGRCEWIRQADTPEEFQTLLRTFLNSPRGDAAEELRRFAETIARCGDGLGTTRIVDAVQSCLRSAQLATRVGPAIEPRTVGV